MKRILIIVLALIVIAVAAGIFFLVRGSGNAGNTPGSDILPTGLPVAMVPSSTSVSALRAGGPLPTDAPQGNTFTLQIASGTMVVKNFYNTAQGYFPGMDAVMLEKNDSYAIWYYRSTGHFDIWFSPGAGSAADEAAAAQSLESDLGIDQKSLCMLSAGEVFQADQGSTNETGPLMVCSNGAFQ